MKTIQPGVLVMAFGTPGSPDELADFYTRIRRGRPPGDEELAGLAARYEAIGGSSPLAEISEAQRAEIAHMLGHKIDRELPVVLGQMYAAPFIEDALAELARHEVTHIVAVVLSPHYSEASIGGYLARANEARLRHGIEMTSIEHWHLLPPLLEFLSRSVDEARSQVPARHIVLFSAHSLPEHLLVDDPYPDELARSAQAVAKMVGLDATPPMSGATASWELCWQSAGRNGRAWRGPDIADSIRVTVAEHATEGVVVCPQGFSADNLEILYDIDIVARAVADELGIAFARTRMPNADRGVMSGIAGLIAARMARRRMI